LLENEIRLSVAKPVEEIAAETETTTSIKKKKVSRKKSDSTSNRSSIIPDEVTSPTEVEKSMRKHVSGIAKKSDISISKALKETSSEPNSPNQSISVSARTKLNMHKLNSNNLASMFKPPNNVPVPSDDGTPKRIKSIGGPSVSRERSQNKPEGPIVGREKSQNKPISAFAAMPSKSIMVKEEVPYGKVKVGQICKLPEGWDEKGIYY
jgi:hypothetical protein